VRPIAVRGKHLLCDVCGAVTPVGSDRAGAWEEIAWQHGAPLHLCERCVDERERGTLAALIRCVDCGRDDRDGVTEWRVVTAPDGSSRETICIDCYNARRDAGTR